MTEKLKARPVKPGISLEVWVALMLFCNVVSVGAIIFKSGAGWAAYISLMGCVYFGGHVWEIIRVKR